jgi:hypothetical protein
MMFERQCWLWRLASKHIVGIEWREGIGLDHQSNSLSGGFAEVELEGDKTVDNLCN